MKVSEHFVLQEFIDPVTFEQEGENAITFIDNKLIDINEFIRVESGLPITINDWHKGGQFKESGLRNKDSITGAKKSAHKIGKATDSKIKGWSGKEWYDFVVKHAKKLYDLGLRQIEDKSLATTWGHLSTREHGKKGIIQVVDLTRVSEEINANGI